MFIILKRFGSWGRGHMVSTLKTKGLFLLQTMDLVDIASVPEYFLTEMTTLSSCGYSLEVYSSFIVMQRQKAHYNSIQTFLALLNKGECAYGCANNLPSSRTILTWNCGFCSHCKP